MKGTAYKRKSGWVVISNDDWYWSSSGYKKRKQEIPIHPDYVGYFLSDGLEVEFETFMDRSEGLEYARIEVPEDYVMEEEIEEVEVIVPEPTPEPVKEDEPPVVKQEYKPRKKVKTISKMETSNSFFTKSRIIRITIICALLTQINHASSLFYLLSDQSTFSFIMSWVFAVSLESSIYIFTMFGKRNTALFFGLISWAVNILHYWFEIGLTQKFVAMNIISPIIPITIYFYSELIQEERQSKVQETIEEES